MSGKVGFVSLGCPKALVDSERILTGLRAEGYDLVKSYSDAEVVVVNTCGFITPAIEESLDAIGEALSEASKVVVTGCLGEMPEKILTRHPNVLAITGQADIEGVMEAIHENLPPDNNPFTSLLPLPSYGVKLTPKHYSYLKIAEGCNHSCSFCIIPKLRGHQISRDASEILYEAYRLINIAGNKELMVIAQDTSAYGSDIRHRASEFQGRKIRAHLTDLVTELSAMDAWVRLHYVYPYPHIKDLIPLMAEGKLLPYLDVPLQHASPNILKRMHRPGGAISHLQTIKEWRSVCPELAIRSTFIVGFPGETEDDFLQLLSFLEEANIDHVGAFKYSNVVEAEANQLPNHVPEEVKQDRYDRLMSLQQKISLGKKRSRIGQTMDIIVDDYGELPGDIIGRTKYDAPDIDGKVFAVSDGTVKIGDIVKAKIVDANAYDYFAEID